MDLSKAYDCISHELLIAKLILNAPAEESKGQELVHRSVHGMI